MIAVDKEFLNGHRWSACGWFRQTSKSAKQDAKEAYQAHDCSKFPPPYTNRELVTTLLAKRRNMSLRKAQESLQSQAG
jgi:hypothetical protein